jgi:thermitase
MENFSKYLLGTVAALGLILSSVYATTSVANLSMQVQFAMIGDSIPTENNTAQLAAAGGVKGAPASSPAATNSSASANSPQAGTTTAAVEIASVAPATAASDIAKYVTGQILVKFKDGTSQANQDAALKANNASVKSTINHIGVNIVKVPDGAEAKVAAALAHNPNVQFAEVDGLVTPDAIPNDPAYSTKNAYYYKFMEAPAGWDITTGSPAVTVAILDSGIDSNHVDLAANMVPGYNFVQNNSSTGPDGSCPHGTTVAGAAGEVGNNGIGGTGMGWNIKLMPLVIADPSISCSGSWSAIASAYTYAADHGVRVINISYGGPTQSSTEASAAAYAWSKGAVIFAAAGNSGNTALQYPAATKNVVGVAGTDLFDQHAVSSSYGSYIKLSAYFGAYTTDVTGTSGWNTSASPAGDYINVNGTSFSSPLAAGLAALVLSVNPNLTNQQIVDLMEQNADDWGTPGFDIYFGYGRINVWRTLYAAAGLKPTVDTTAPTVSLGSPVNNFGGQYTNGTVPIRPVTHDDFGVTKMELYKDGALYLTQVGGPFNFSWGTKLETDGSTHTLYTKGYDAAGNVGTSGTWTTTVDNTLPTVTFVSPTDGATVSGKVTLKTYATDTGSGVYMVVYHLDGGFISSSSAYSCGTGYYCVDWNSASSTNGTHILRADAYDRINNIGTTSITITVNNLGTVTTDTTAPSVPTGVTGAAVSSTQIKLSWSPSTDNVGVAGYKVYRGGVQVGTSATAAYSDTTLSASTAYTYTVAAYDAAGNVSAQSSAVTVTTQALADTQAPVTSISSPLAGATVNSTVGVSASASDNVAVTKAELYVDGVLASTMTASPYLFSWDTTKVANGSHTLQTKAYDAAGNVGTSAAIGVNVSNVVVSDVTAPALTITSPKSGAKLKTSGNTSLAASASDPSSIASIVISFDGIVKKTCTLATSCSYSLSNKTVTTGTHTVTVTATDNSVNHNVATASVGVSK